jgi:hypothetical protein
VLKQNIGMVFSEKVKIEQKLSEFDKVKKTPQKKAVENNENDVVMVKSNSLNSETKGIRAAFGENN